MNRPGVSDGLRRYVEAEILPRYDGFDAAHRRDHAETVIRNSLSLGSLYDADPDILYVAAAYHDTGLVVGRERHHTESARIIRADARLREWLSEEQIGLAADAAEDHRASASRAPRTLYGRIVAEADRNIEPTDIIRRTIRYSLGHFPGLDKGGHWERCREHLSEKYGDGGYLKLWIPESANAVRLEELRRIIRNPETLRSVFERLWEEEEDQ